MTKRAQIQARIKEVRKELESGKDRVHILEKFGKSWNVRKSSVDSYIKVAKELIAADSDKVQAISDERIQQEAEQAVFRVLSVARKREILRQIADGELEIPVKRPVWDKDQNKWVSATVISTPSHADRMKAIDLDSKLSGDFAPEEVDLDVNLNTGVDLSKLTDEQLNKILDE